MFRISSMSLTKYLEHNISLGTSLTIGSHTLAFRGRRKTWGPLADPTSGGGTWRRASL